MFNIDFKFKSYNNNFICITSLRRNKSNLNIFTVLKKTIQIYKIRSFSVKFIKKIQAVLFLRILILFYNKLSINSLRFFYSVLSFYCNCEKFFFINFIIILTSLKKLF